MGAPKPLVLAGYGLSSLVRPFIGLATDLGARALAPLRRSSRQRHPQLARAMRCSRRSPTRPIEAACSGFTAAMDHAGAVLGPLLASAFLYFHPDDYRTPVRADDHPRHHRHPHPVAGAGYARVRAPMYRSGCNSRLPMPAPKPDA